MLSAIDISLNWRVLNLAIFTQITKISRYTVVVYWATCTLSKYKGSLEKENEYHYNGHDIIHDCSLPRTIAPQALGTPYPPAPYAGDPGIHCMRMRQSDRVIEILP